MISVHLAGEAAAFMGLGGDSVEDLVEAVALSTGYWRLPKEQPVPTATTRVVSLKD